MDDFLHDLGRRKLLRKAIDIINTDDTVVVLLSQNVEAAMQHYNKIYSPLPEFRILDVTEEEDLRAISKKFNVQVFAASRVKEYAHKKCCLYSRPSFLPWGAGSYLESFVYIRQLGITSFFIDKRSVEGIHLWGVNRLPWTYFEENIGLFKEIYALFNDQDSRDVYTGVVRYRLTGDTGYIPYSDYPQYNHPKALLCPGEVAIEAGALNGDTANMCARLTGPAGKVIAFEPVPESCAISRQRAAAPNILIEEMGLWSRPENMYVEPTETYGASYCTDKQSRSALACTMTSLDSYLEHKNERCDFLKLDVEGAELEVLKGAEQTLRKYKPKLAISVYHSPLKDFLYIPKFINDLNVGYEFYLGHHSAYFMETVLYCSRKMQS